jgi:outer membrane receptor protein involved in Fe transport
LSAFYSRYDSLISLHPGYPFPVMPPSPVQFVYPVTIENNGSGTSIGAEASASWSPKPWLKLGAGYARLRVRLRGPDLRTSELGNTPEHQANVRAALDLPWRLSLDGAAFWEDSYRVLKDLDSERRLPAHTRLDARLARPIGRDWELTASVENVLGHSRVSFEPEGFVRGSLVGRSVRAGVAWRPGK